MMTSNCIIFSHYFTLILVGSLQMGPDLPDKPHISVNVQSQIQGTVMIQMFDFR